MRGAIIAGLAVVAASGTAAPALAAPGGTPVTEDQCVADDGKVQRADDGVGTCVGGADDGRLIKDLGTTTSDEDRTSSGDNTASEDEDRTSSGDNTASEDEDRTSSGENTRRTYVDDYGRQYYHEDGRVYYLDDDGGRYFYDRTGDVVDD